MKLPDPTMVALNADSHIRIIRESAWYSNECLIDALCEMAKEDPYPSDAVRHGLIRLGNMRDLLRCPENQED
jgi:hypothetical protein